MIVRLVKMTFQPDKIKLFLDNFKNSKDGILAFEGCHLVELLQDQTNPNVFFTHSHWQSEAHLNAYRQSDYFKAVWTKTKFLFAERPEAWSTCPLTP